MFYSSNGRTREIGGEYRRCCAHNCNIESHDIKGKNSAVGKLLSKHKRGSHFNLHSSCGSLFFNLWLDGAACLFANNDFDSNAMGTVTGQIHNKSKGEYHGRRSYQANEAIRCYRYVHNNVDIHN